MFAAGQTMRARLSHPTKRRLAEGPGGQAIATETVAGVTTTCAWNEDRRTYKRGALQTWP